MPLLFLGALMFGLGTPLLLYGQRLLAITLYFINRRLAGLYPGEECFAVTDGRRFRAVQPTLGVDQSALVQKKLVVSLHGPPLGCLLFQFLSLLCRQRLPAQPPFVRFADRLNEAIMA